MSEASQTNESQSQSSPEEKGGVDGVSLLYIAFGIPAMWLFLVVLFSAVKLWDIPA
jgi:hypothetical protein